MYHKKQSWDGDGGYSRTSLKSLIGAHTLAGANRVHMWHSQLPLWPPCPPFARCVRSVNISRELDSCKMLNSSNLQRKAQICKHIHKHCLWSPLQFSYSQIIINQRWDRHKTNEKYLVFVQFKYDFTFHHDIRLGHLSEHYCHQWLYPGNLILVWPDLVSCPVTLSTLTHTYTLALQPVSLSFLHTGWCWCSPGKSYMLLLLIRN